MATFPEAVLRGSVSTRELRFNFTGKLVAIYSPRTLSASLKGFAETLYELGRAVASVSEPEVEVVSGCVLLRSDSSYEHFMQDRHERRPRPSSRFSSFGHQ